MRTKNISWPENIFSFRSVLMRQKGSCVHYPKTVIRVAHRALDIKILRARHTSVSASAPWPNCFLKGAVRSCVIPFLSAASRMAASSECWEFIALYSLQRSAKNQPTISRPLAAQLSTRHKGIAFLLPPCLRFRIFKCGNSMAIYIPIEVAIRTQNFIGNFNPMDLNEKIRGLC